MKEVYITYECKGCKHTSFKAVKVKLNNETGMLDVHHPKKDFHWALMCPYCGWIVR